MSDFHYISFDKFSYNGIGKRGCKIYFACSGGVTHFALAPDDDKSVMTIAWGQNALNGMLSNIYV